MNVYTPETILVLVGVLIAGILYSIYIAYRPFRDGRTWISVVVGVGFTIGPFAWVVYELTGDPWLATLIFVFFAASGGPMIVGQVTKDRVLNEIENNEDHYA